MTSQPEPTTNEPVNENGLTEAQQRFIDRSKVDPVGAGKMYVEEMQLPEPKGVRVTPRSTGFSTGK